MLATIYTKSVRDRWLGALIAAAGVILVGAFGIWVYNDLDDIFQELLANYPEAMIAMLGLGDAESTASLVLAQVYNVIGPFAVGGLAIAIGAGTIAGEERDGTFGVLMSHPRTRLHVLFSKLAALETVLLGAAVLIWAGSVASLALVGADRTGDVVAATVHLFAFTLFLGVMSLALGSATGNATLASGLSTGVMVLSFLGAGIFQAIEGWEWVARVFPWYWYNSSTPLENGLDWAHLGVMVGLIAVGTAIAVFALQRRDLMTNRTGSLLQVIRDHPRFAPIAEKVSGRPMIANMAVKSITDHRALTSIGAMAVLYTALLVGPLYNLISEPLADFTDAMPDALLAIIGSADFGTPEGWLMGEVFSITAPAAVLAVTVLVGVRGLAGEEKRRTLGALAAMPVARATIVDAKTAAVVATSTAVGFATFAGTALGVLLGGLDVSWLGIVAISVHLTLLGIMFGLVALAIGGATGKTRVAGMTTAGLALAAYVVYGFFPIRESLADWVVISPFDWYAGSNPLVEGFDWGRLAALAVGSLIAWLAARWAFERHDIST